MTLQVIIQKNLKNQRIKKISQMKFQEKINKVQQNQEDLFKLSD